VGKDDESKEVILPSRQLEKVKDRLMSKFYTAEHRALQDKFDTRRVAEMMENRVVHSEFAEQVRAFIESLDMFFLSTVDAFGRPIGSYKGGAPGFTASAYCRPGNGWTQHKMRSRHAIAKRSRTRAEKSPGKPTLICSPRERLRRGCVLADAKTSPGPIPAKIKSLQRAPELF
jgi:Pyridoxamine 5'-phosphate oxidase